MKIGILGTGDVGQALRRGFKALGHEVKMGGSRTFAITVDNHVAALR